MDQSSSVFWNELLDFTHPVIKMYGDEAPVRGAKLEIQQELKARKYVHHGQIHTTCDTQESRWCSREGQRPKHIFIKDKYTYWAMDRECFDAQFLSRKARAPGSTASQITPSSGTNLRILQWTGIEVNAHRWARRVQEYRYHGQNQVSKDVEESR